jgi:hypothetical protein
MYVKLDRKDLWPRTIITSFSFVTTLYVFIGALGYYVFGSFLASTSTVLDAVARTTTIGSGLVISGQAAIALHVASVLPILANPVFLAVRSLPPSRSLSWRTDLSCRWSADRAQLACAAVVDGPSRGGARIRV